MGYVDLGTLHAPVGGQRPPAAYGRQIEANFDFLASPPRCRVYNSAAISIPTSTWTPLTFNSERYDTDTMHSTATDTSRITFTTAGVYVVGGHASFAANGSGVRFCRLVGAGATIAHGTNPQNGNGTHGNNLEVHTEYRFAAGDYVEFQVYQDSGGDLNVVAAGNYSPEVYARWVAL